MGKSTVVPFGPQHPVLPEPIHFDLELEDEKVIKAIPSIGYVHRGLEKLVEKRGFQEYVYVAERVCGICSFGHGWGYSKAIEGLMEIEIPKRAEYLRTIWHEISRLQDWAPTLWGLRVCLCSAGVSVKRFWISSNRPPADGLSFPSAKWAVCAGIFPIRS